MHVLKRAMSCCLRRGTIFQCFYRSIHMGNTTKDEKRTKLLLYVRPKKLAGGLADHTGKYQVHDFADYYLEFN